MTATIDTGDPVAVVAVTAVHDGDVGGLRRLLAGHPQLARARLGDGQPCGMTRSLLHVATDWPGHYPNGVATVRALIEAGADVHARRASNPPPNASSTAAATSTGSATTSSPRWTPPAEATPTTWPPGWSATAPRQPTSYTPQRVLRLHGVSGPCGNDHAQPVATSTSLTSGQDRTP